MSHLESTSDTRTRRRGLMLLIGLLASVVTFAVGGEIALAHHSEITAAADCGGTVTYQAISWQTSGSNNNAAGTNTKVNVWYTRSDTGSTTYPVTTSKFDNTNNYRFSGTFDWPASSASTITVYVQEQVKWGDGGAISAATSTTVTKPANCTTSIATPVCVTGQNSSSVAVTLTNTSAVLPNNTYPNPPYTNQVNFNVVPSAGTTGAGPDYLVTAGSPKVVTFTGVPSGTFTATIKVGPTLTDKSVSIAVKCQTGSVTATATASCVAGSGQVVVTFAAASTDAQASTVVVTKPTGTTTSDALTFTLQPGGSKTVTFSGVADSDPFTVSYTVNGGGARQVTAKVNCKTGSVTVTPVASCVGVNGGKVVVTFAAAGTDGLASTVVVTKPAGTTTSDALSFTLQPGASQTVTFTGVGNATFMLSYTVNGVSKSVSVAVNCSSGSVTVTPVASCVGVNGGKVVVTFAAAGTDGLASTVVVTKPAGTTTSDALSFTLQPGASKTVTFTGVGNATFMLSYTVNGVSKSVSVAVNCSSGSVTVTPVASCVGVNGGKVVVTFAAAGTDGLASTVVVGSASSGSTVDSTSFTLQPGASKTVTFTGVGNATFMLSYTVNGGTAQQVSAAVNCSSGSVTVTPLASCVAGSGQVVVTFAAAVTDGLASTVVVGSASSGGTGDSTSFTLQPGASKTVTFTGVGNATFMLSYTVNGVSKSVSVAVNCSSGSVTVTPVASCVGVNGGQVVVTFAAAGTDGLASTVVVGSASSGSTVDSTSFTLQPGASQTVTFTGVGNATFMLSYTVNGGTAQQVTAPVNCSSGSVTVTPVASCVAGSGQVVVTFAAAGTDGLASTVVVGSASTGSTVDSTSFTLQPGASQTVTFTGVGNATFMLSYTVNGGTAQQVTAPVNCSSGSVTVTPVASCVGVNSGKVVVTFAAAGTDGLASTVVVGSASTGSTVDSTSFTLQPGASKTVTFTAVGNATFMLSYTVNGGTAQQVTAPVNCSSGSVTVTPVASCVGVNGGKVVVTFAAAVTDGLASTVVVGSASTGSTVDSTSFTLQPGASKTVTFTAVGNATFMLSYTVNGGTAQQVTAPVNCSSGGTATAVAACVAFDGVVTVTLTQTGDLPAVFVLDGVTYTVVAGTSQTVTFSGLADGAFTNTYTVNGGTPIALPSLTIACNPKVAVAAICNEVGTNGTVTIYWFTITNTEAVPVDVTWADGSATVPANGSVTVKTSAASIAVKYGADTVASGSQNGSVCGKTVTFTKSLIGSPKAVETYTVQVSRLVGATAVPVLTFNIAAGATSTFTLPSTFDPSGINYTVVETAFGTASTHTVSPSSFTLNGNLGQAVSVVITNGYASVGIDKTVSAPTVGADEQLTYTLVGTNTGALTLNPVLITDRLPANVSFISALVDNGGGTCTVVDATVRPQVINCAMTGSLAPGASTQAVTIRVLVDQDTAAGVNLVNQARVIGSYTGGSVTGPPVTAALSCIPVLDGTVCNLSAAVSTLVTAQEVGLPPVPPTPTTVAQEAPVLTVPPTVQPLPVTGSSGIGNILAVALVLVGLGGFILIRRRRPNHSRS